MNIVFFDEAEFKPKNYIFPKLVKTIGRFIMSGNNIFCTKCNSHHHPIEECDEAESFFDDNELNVLNDALTLLTKLKKNEKLRVIEYLRSRYSDNNYTFPLGTLGAAIKSSQNEKG